jgi:hypothetical protein
MRMMMALIQKRIGNARRSGTALKKKRAGAIARPPGRAP